ncbi:two-component system histidine kinase PnpS [Staphylococcus carnosus]|uniref:two-component system histidine kinase PnpS n=1 Tax=Staphylococcus carnosus TaxID=1281 RepID=UPI00081A43F6|nr:ATP-binding protein [Staphylococcus carnosus]ANZ33169.1 histidine kinase [Staphylococcus carnosus]UTB80497.1 histidine kinase [Staphylococcus carnosus]UTB85319.1 histidine kinase [Staphylococcus carnosus]
MKFYTRLLLTLVTLIVSCLIALGLLINHAIYTTISGRDSENLKNDAERVNESYQAHQDNAIREYARLNDFAITVHRNSDHKVLFKAGNNVPANENINVVGNPSNLIYDTHKGNHRFTYKYIDNDHHIIISGYNNEISQLQFEAWKYIVIIGMFILAVVFLIVRNINRTYIRPINDVTYATKLLAQGHYHIRVPESNVKETRALFVTTNELARRLQKMHNEQKIQSNRLKTTLENIPSSVLMIDKYGKIVVANTAYYDMFNPETSVVNKNYNRVIQGKLNTLIINAFKTEKTINEQVEIYINNVHEKYFDTACVPILSRNKKRLQGMVVVLHDITSLKKLENLRREFVANVSHELKTPITSIKGFAETLIDGAKNDENSLDEFLNIILKESNRIESLVEDLLDLSHIEQQTEIRTERVDLSEVTQTTVNTLYAYAQRKAIEIDAEIQNHVMIDAEASKIAQVVTNLVSNAINYSSDESTVYVRVYQKDDKRILEVEDHGIGIAPEEQKHVFERFYRVDKARSRDSGGTGLGLSITKHIVEAYQGRMQIESEPDVGTTFRIIFFDNKTRNS